MQVLEVPDASTAAAIERRLAARDGVVAVERDVRVTLQNGSAWGLDNVGQLINGSPGLRGADSGAALAWPHATGRGTVVAVVDTGVDITHPLLRDRIWRNPGERPDGTDSDGNGYVDDLHGWDFVNGSPQVFHSAAGDAHGTHVAGIVAGRFDPTTGFRGVAPDARIMPLRFIDADGSGWTSDAIAAIRYAAANGADVVNLSFGGPDRSMALRAAMEEARIPVIVAAGNTNLPHERSPVWPAMESLPNQLTVAALDHRGELAPFSASSRRTVHVAAPGAHILSTVPGGRLATASGTSMAAPFVAGIVALAVEASPAAGSAEQLLHAVRQGIRPLRGADQTVTGGIARATGTLAALGTPVPVCATVRPTNFRDVPAAHTHHLGVACLAATGVTAGVSSTRYGAELGLTRAQVATMVVNALRPAGVVPAVPAGGRFGDIAGSVHRDNVEALASVGIVRGVTGTRYEPERTVTRAEFAAIVARAAEHAAGATLRSVTPVFGDVAGSPERDAIEMAAALSLVSGRSPGVFDPHTSLRRDQAASMLVRLLDRLHQQGLTPAVP